MDTNSITQMQQICGLQIHDENLFHHIAVRSGDCGGLLSTIQCVLFKKPVGDDFSFVTWFIILLACQHSNGGHHVLSGLLMGLCMPGMMNGGDAGCREHLGMWFL